MQCLLNVYDRAKERTSMSRTCNENIQYPRKVGQLEHAQTVCTRLFSEKEAGNEANIYTSTENKIYDNSSSSREIQ